MENLLYKAFAKIEPVTDEQGSNPGDLKEVIGNVIGAITGMLALVCVVVMIIGGINYMTSAGDPGKVKKAKDTILYGLVGLAICGFAYAIVNFVVNNVIMGNNG